MHYLGSLFGDTDDGFAGFTLLLFVDHGKDLFEPRHLTFSLFTVLFKRRAQLLEQMGDREFQFCIVDPEGNYTGCQGAVVIGSARREPDLTEVVRQLETPEADLPVIASTLQKEVDDLFPIAETLQMLRFADIGGGDLCLIEAGRSFAECTVRMIGWSRGATLFQIASFEVWPRTLFSLARL